MADLITPDLVDLNLSATERGEATKSLAERLLAAVRAREAQMATGIEGGIGIPHCRSVAVVEPTLAFGRSAQGIDWGAADGPAHLIFLIAAPEGGGAEHMGILAKLARKLIHASFRDSLHQAQDPEAVVTIVKKEVLGQ